MNNRNSEVLAQKSRELLIDQLNSIDSINFKSGIFTSISSLFIPLAIGLYDNFVTGIFWITLYSIPIIINLIGLYLIIKCLYPKKISHGINFNEFDNLINKNDVKDIFDFEIAINRDSFRDNEKTLKKLNNNVKNGLTLIYISVVCLMIIFLINLIITESKCYG